MAERRPGLFAPRTLTRRGGRWSGRIARLSAVPGHGRRPVLGGRLTRWRPLLGNLRAAYRLPVTARVLRRPRGVRHWHHVVRLERRTRHAVLVTRGGPGVVRQSPTAIQWITVRPRPDRPRPDRARPPAPWPGPASPARPATAAALVSRSTRRLRLIQAPLIGRTLGERAGRLRLLGERRAEQVGKSAAMRRARAAAPPRSPRSRPMIMHPAVSRPSSARHRAEPPAPSVPGVQGLASFAPAGLAREPFPAVAMDELVEQVLRRIERRALAQRERMGRS